MAEKEYIEREALIEKLETLLSDLRFILRFIVKYEKQHGNVIDIEKSKAKLETVKEIINPIKSQPTADVQEVIRCKDCIFGKYDDDLNMILCKRIYNLSGGEYVYNDLNDFCSYGERLDGDNND